MDQEAEIHIDLILVAGIGIGTDWASGVQFPSNATDFLHSIRSGAYAVVPGTLASERKQPEREAEHLHLLPRSRIV
jgi:hypothetical protein